MPPSVSAPSPCLDSDPLSAPSNVNATDADTSSAPSDEVSVRVSVSGPVPVMPRVPPVSAIVLALSPSAASSLTRRRPAWMAMSPVKLLTPLSSASPLPYLTSVPVPLRVPVWVTVPAPSKPTVVPVPLSVTSCAAVKA